jgi:hypothetical protein
MRPKLFLTMGVVLCFVASVSFAAGPKKNRKVQTPPIKLGTTGGNVNFILTDGTQPPCASGTLGALVEKRGTQYILSASSLLGRLNKAKKGEEVIQPGLRFTKGGKCNAANPSGNTVAELAKFKKIKFKTGKTNKSEGALARVNDGMVDPNGTVIGIGQPGKQLVAPKVGQRVRKSGAGTGVNVGQVIAVKATGDVAYGRPFGSPPFARFVKQFIVESLNNKALATGEDLGAVFFENRGSCPGWVGLAFATTEDGRLVLATPMKAVLKDLKKKKPKGPFKPVGCENAAAALEEPQSLQMQQSMRDAERIQDQVESLVMRLPGVIGMGLGVAQDNPEEVVIKIFVEEVTETIRKNIPKRLGKVRSEIVATGRFYAM